MTVLAVEAIRRSGLPGYENTLRLAEHWLMDNQETDGIWHEWLMDNGDRDDESFPFPFMTVLVLEYFEWAEEVKPAKLEKKTTEEREAGEKKPRPIKRTKRQEEEKKTRALLLLKKHPEWTDTKIAREVEVHRSTLYSWPEYKALRAILKAEEIEKYKSALDRTAQEKARDYDDPAYVPPEIDDSL